MSNFTTRFDVAIDRLEETLESARGLPQYAIVLIVILVLVSAILLLHVCAFVLAAPCLWMTFCKRMKVVEREGEEEEGEEEEEDDDDLNGLSSKR